MSLDLWLKNETNNEDLPSFNYTYNVSPMWYVAVPYDSRMVEIENLTGAQALSKLQFALDRLRAEPEKYSALNPENGWGSYEGFCGFIERLINASEKYPTAKWEAWR